MMSYPCMSQLHELACQSCGLSDMLPGTWQLQRVQRMQLSRNAIFGAFPLDWNSNSLATLDLSFNQLSSLPLDTLCAGGTHSGLPGLQRLHLQGNSIGGMGLPSGESARR
jgi:hypothetical protein